MIFVTVGTGKFEKLVKAADKLGKNIKEKIIIQKGSSMCDVKNVKCFDFTDEFDKYVEEADLIISHGGAGTIFDLLNKNKKIIALANLNRTDKHQKEILEALGKEDHLIHCKDFNLKGALTKAKKFKYKKYKKPFCEIDKKIIEFLD